MIGIVFSSYFQWYYM